jgi:hypothetical protein
MATMCNLSCDVIVNMRRANEKCDQLPEQEREHLLIGRKNNGASDSSWPDFRRLTRPACSIFATRRRFSGIRS